MLPIAKRKRKDADNNNTEYDVDDNNTDVDVDNSRDVAETIYKPDWAVFTNDNPMISIIGTLELKVLYNRNPGYVPD